MDALCYKSLRGIPLLIKRKVGQIPLEIYNLLYGISFFCQFLIFSELALTDYSDKTNHFASFTKNPSYSIISIPLFK